MRIDLPVAVDIGGEKFEIRGRCDYRIILDCIEVLNDEDMDDDYKAMVAMKIFYPRFRYIKDFKTALREMYRVIAAESESDEDDRVFFSEPAQSSIVDWLKDFKFMVAPINHVLGYDVRDPERYTHWFTFVGAFMEMGECAYRTALAIRSKRARGKKLEKWEQDFYRENRRIVDVKKRLTSEQKEFLFWGGDLDG